MQRSPALAASQRSVSGAGAFARLIDLPDDNCVQRRIMPFRARQIIVEQLGAAYAPVANFAR